MHAEIRYGGFWRRALALLIDVAFVLLACWGVELIARGAYGATAWSFGRVDGRAWPSYDDAWDPLVLEAFETLVLIAISAPYFVLGPLRTGATWGKRWLGMEIRQAFTFGAPTRPQLIRRYLGYPLSLTIFFCGFLMAVFHPRKRTLHDWLGGTVVLRRGAGPVTLALLAASGGVGGMPIAEARPVVALSGFRDAPLTGLEAQASLVTPPLEDRWVYLGPRAAVQWAAGGEESRARVFVGGEGIVWMANAIGPGLAADWRVAKGEFRFEPSVSARLRPFGPDGAWSLRLGFPLQTGQGWGLKLGAMVELGGVP